MDHVNNTLLLSLKQEIQILNEVVRSITQSCHESVEINSWLFPTKSYQFVNGLINDGSFELDDFRSYLELIVDRLYVGIRLILNYVDSSVKEETRKNQFIHRPKQLTLGFTFQALWSAVATILAEKMNKTIKATTTTVDDNIVYTVNKGTQTDIMALNKCDSCSSAMLCMKNLLQSFENQDLDNLYNERHILRPKIYDITQFGCMLQTTTTIENSLNTLFEKLFTKEQENELLRNEQQKLKSEFTNTFGKITLLEREVDIFKEKYEKDTIKITFLSSENEDLLKTKAKYEFQIQTLEGVINNLNNSIKSYRESSQIMNQEKESIINSLEKISESQTSLIRMSSLIQNKFCVIESEHIWIENALREAENVTDRINNKLNTIKPIYNLVKSKIENIHKNLENNSCFIVSKCQDFQKNVKQHITNCSIRESRTLLNQDVRTFEIKGNPVEDLTKQIEENNEKIELLQKENTKLQKIIMTFNRNKT